MTREGCLKDMLFIYPYVNYKVLNQSYVMEF